MTIWYFLLIWYCVGVLSSLIMCIVDVWYLTYEDICLIPTLGGILGFIMIIGMVLAIAKHLKYNFNFKAIAIDFRRKQKPVPSVIEEENEDWDEDTDDNWYDK